MANTKITPHVLDSTLISGHSTVTAATNDFVLIQDVSDSNALKKALVSDLAQNEESPTFTGNVTVNGALTVDTTTLAVDASNNRVGIGTASPAYRLDVQDSSDPAQIRLKEDGNTNGFIFKNYNGNEAQLVNADNGPMVFKTNDLERMRIGSGGEVGIGTNNPGRLLHLYANSSGDTAVMRIQDNGSHVAGIELYSGHGNWGIYNSDTVGDALEFRDDSAGATRMMIDSAGRVIIKGTTNASADGLSNLTLGNGVGDAGISIYSATDGNGRIMFADGTSGGAQYDGFIAYDHTNQRMNIGTAGSGASDITISSAGHVSLESTARLYLDGLGDTYMSEYSANEFEIVTGNTRKFALSGGNLYHTGSLNSNHNFSDERLKDNIVVIPNALEKVSSLRGITFTRKDDGSVGTGLIAQELEKVLPEAVYESKIIDSLEDPDAEQYKAINYGTTVGLLVEAIKELEARIKTLEG